MWDWIKDLCGAAAFMLSLYLILMWGYVLEGVLQ
jgi:diacylglycerol kinase